MEYKIGDWVYVLDSASANVINNNVYQVNDVKDNCRIQKCNGIGYHLDNKKSTYCWLLSQHIRLAEQFEIPIKFRTKQQYYFY